MRPDADSFSQEPPRARTERGAPPVPSGRAAEGKGSPLLPVFTVWRQRFRELALRMLGDESDADDVLQDAFLRLWPRREAIRTENDAAALTGATVKHLCIDTLRKRRHEGPIDEQTAAVPDDTDARKEREERFRAVEAAVDDCLTPLQRRILRMRDYEDAAYADIATRLDMQEAAVRMQLSRARKAIRQQWRNYLRE